MNENLTTKEIATINSKEVAEMMEMEHKTLLRKIDSINKDFGSAKVCHENYWVESTYENRGKDYRCYEVTKMGCEFLAHKSTGKKGNIFTAKYMERFNEMEKELQQIQVASYMISDPIERAKKWIEEETIRQEQAKLLEEQKPLVDFASTVHEAGNAITIGAFAKALREEKGIKIGRNILFQRLREFKVLDKKNLPYQKFLDKGWFKVIEKTMKVDNDEDFRLYVQTLITGKGQVKVYDLLKNKGVI